MELKNLTIQQGSEILNLIFPFSDCIKSEVKHSYQPANKPSKDNYEGDDERYLMTFDGTIFGDKIDRIRVWIWSDLDCEIDYIRDHQQSGRLPVRNQRLIQQKFTEFGFKYFK
jgi:hypothetical protein